MLPFLGGIRRHREEAVIGNQAELGQIDMADRSHGRSEGEEYVLLKHVGYRLVAIGGDDGVEHEYFDFEVVVG